MCSLNAARSTENRWQLKAEYSALNKTFMHPSRAGGTSGNGGRKNVIGVRQDLEISSFRHDTTFAFINSKQWPL